MKNRSSEERVQGMVHSLESGALAHWIRLALTFAAFLALALILLFVRFPGLSAGEGMDQAQIAREFARGNGLVSQNIQPIDIGFANERGEETLEGKVPNTYYAPLWPIVLGSTFKLVDFENWHFGKGNWVYPGDRLVAIVGTIFLLLSFAAAWVLGWQAFDKRVAWTGVFLMAITPMFWEFAMSGLSQPLVFFLFLLALNTLFRAVFLQTEEQKKGILFWLIATAVLMGLSTLAHGLVFWAMLAVLIFVALAFSHRRWMAGVMLVVYLAVLTPWFLHNQAVFGNPFGKGIFSIYEGVRGSVGVLFSQVNPELGNVPFGGLLRKTVTGVVDQFSSMLALQGGILLVPFFLLALLHAFRRPATGLFRWGIFLIWLSLIFGMGLFGRADKALSVNQLQFLVTPLFIFYAIALMFVMTTRFSSYSKLIRIAMLVIVFALASAPMINMLFFNRQRFEYPPYLPPSIVIMGQLTEPDENVSADISWAVAWYADRRTLQIPETPELFTEISDFRRIGGPIAGLLITPYSANSPMLLEVMQGRWKPWSAYISRSNPNLRNFPCPVPITLPPENQYLGLFDRKRWQ